MKSSAVAMKKKTQKYIAIERRNFYKTRRYHALHGILGGDFPMALMQDFGDPDVEPYGEDSIDIPRNQRLTKEYFIIPIASVEDEWGGVPLLFKINERILAAKERHIDEHYSTISLPHLRHNEKGERLSLLQVGSSDYKRIKKIMGDDLIEAKSFDDFVDQFRSHLPDEPVRLDLDDPVKTMMSRVPEGPLNGVVVVSFEQQVAGPLASEELVRAGATVIKIEKSDGDPKRVNSGQTSFNTFNAGKFSVAFGHSAEDQKLKEALLAKADVIIDNRSGAAQLRDDILQKTLKQKNREKPVIFCAISGFGRGQPIPAYDRSVQAASGMAELNGKLIPFPVIDMATGKEAAREISTYLYKRERMTPSERANNPCIRLDVSMLATAHGLMANTIANYLDTGTKQTSIVPFNLYKAQDGKIAVSIATDTQFQTLCDCLKTPELKEHKTNAQRQKKRAVIEKRMQLALKEKTIAEWMDIFKAAHISASPVLDLNTALKTTGRDIIKATTDGGLMVAGPTTNNIYPRNPHIKGAPGLNEDKDLVQSMVGYLDKHAGDPHVIKKAFEVANQDAFQQDYAFVDLNTLDFTKAECDLPWAKGKFFTMRKVGTVTAVPAEPLEVVDIRHNNHFSNKAVAMEGDWKVTTKFGDQYLLPEEKFKKLYLPMESEEGKFRPNPELKPRKAIKVTENIKFMSPWNDTTYIPKGGWIALGNEGAYGIHPNNIKGKEYSVDWVGKSASSGDRSIKK